jgi:flavin-binding protein dodecin
LALGSTLGNGSGTSRKVDIYALRTIAGPGPAFPESWKQNNNPKKAIIMSVLKVIELLGNSTVSFEDAVQNIIKEAAETIKDIRSVYIQDMQVTVKDNKIAQYRVNAKVTFGVRNS